MVLVGRHGSEAGLLEDKGLKVLLCVLLAVFSWVDVNHVEPRLVSVHGVQNDLDDKTSKGDGMTDSFHDTKMVALREKASPPPLHISHSIYAAQHHGGDRQGEVHECIRVNIYVFAEAFALQKNSTRLESVISPTCFS